MSPDWSKVSPAFQQLGPLPPVLTSAMDQVEASLRDALGQYELTLHDEDTVFQGIVWHGIVYSQIAAGAAAGLIPMPLLQILTGVFRANLLILTRSVPPEARP